MAAVVLAGGTGLVGRALAARLMRRPGIALASLVRRPGLSAERTVDFEALVAAPAETLTSLGLDTVDVAISCLGTTIRTAGSRQAFRRVDHDYVLGVARAARAKGARQFILVSSVGAGGRNFYLSVKGDVEAAVAALGFERLDIVRPGLLLGRRPERRVGERIGQMVAPALAPFLPGRLSRYAAIEATIVAAAIDSLVDAPGVGRHVHHNPELRALASRQAAAA